VRVHKPLLITRFRDAVNAKVFWSHFDGTAPVPSLSDPATVTETAAKSQWDKDECSAKSLLTQKLPDSTLMRIHKKVTARERWQAVEKEYTEKGAYMQTDMRAKFLASRCPEKGNVRDFLDKLRMKREELVQVGVEIDKKDYLSTIISSLPISLLSFASTQLAAMRMFAPTKTIEPDILLSLLMEEADRQKAQLARHCASGKGNEEDKEEALVAREKLSRPRKGRGRENIRCWNCQEMGHYSHECKEPKKEDVPKDDKPKAQGTSASAIEPDTECEGAWAAELVEDAIEEGSGSALPISEMDWFEEVVAMMDAEEVVIVPVEIPMRDWFYEVAEGDDKSEDEGASSGDVSVNGFDCDASEGTCERDLGIIGHIWPVYDVYEGIDQLLSTLLGPCQFEVLVAPVVYPEMEYQGGGTTCVSSGRLPDLNAYEIPWIDTTMEWHTHTIVLQASEEVVIHSSEGPKGGEVDADVQVHRSCDIGVIEMLRELDGPREEFAVCEEYLLVPHFEEEEDNQAETMDLPIDRVVPAPIESPTTEIFDLSDSADATPNGLAMNLPILHDISCISYKDL